MPVKPATVAVAARLIHRSAPGGQLRLTHRLTLPPLPVLIPHRPPPAAFPPSRVHRNTMLQLKHHPAAPGGGAPAPACENPAGRRAAGVRPTGGAGLPPARPVCGV